MKKILITGASSGIGLALTKKLLQEGYEVWGVSRRQVIQDTPHYYPIQLDLADAEAVQDACQTIFSKQSFDALIYCAGKGVFGFLEQLNPKTFQANMQVNCLSAMLLAKALIQNMKHKNAGKMLFIGSEASLQGAKQGGLYCATKFALRGFVQSLAEEARASHIGVTMINPGAVSSAFHDQLHFAPSDAPGCTIDMCLLIETISSMLTTDAAGFISEINLQPYRHVIVKQ